MSLDTETAPQEFPLPDARTKEGSSMAKQRILQNAVSDETRRTILREAEDRYLNELLDDEERQLLLDRILRLRRQLGIKA
jgi:hypothetical protein